ncbi:MAG: SRPBCC family protein [Acidobacteriota bacterium]|nr:SRPBCC family protein [Acidobacteriota bacterium]
MRYSFHAEQLLPYPIEQVFAFFSNPDNLPRLMPSWQKARIDKANLIAAQSPPNASAGIRAAAGNGSRITLSFRPVPLSPIRLSWQAEISDFVWNQRFCDTQLRGPFAYWHHCHTVTQQCGSASPEVSAKATLVSDEVHYEPPFGRLGALAQHVFLARQLHGIFAFRHKRTLELLRTMDVRVER